MLAQEIDAVESEPLAFDKANTYVLAVLIPSSTGHIPTPLEQAYFGKILLMYQLLDVLLWVQDWPSHHALHSVPHSHPPTLSPTLERIVKNLDKWTSIIPSTANTAIQHLVHAPQNAALPALPIMSALPTLPVLTAGTLTVQNLEVWDVGDVGDVDVEDAEGPHRFKATISNLIKASQHAVHCSTHDVLEQWHSVAFAISAFRPVSGTLHNAAHD